MSNAHNFHIAVKNCPLGLIHLGEVAGVDCAVDFPGMGGFRPPPFPHLFLTKKLKFLCDDYLSVQYSYTPTAQLVSLDGYTDANTHTQV